jgi:hypothetical protein
MNHRSTPQQKSENIPVEMSFVDFVKTTLISCGRREIVVSNAASKPRIVIMSMAFQMNC